MLSTRPDTRYQGMTDQNGQVTLSGPDVLGPQTVTATAAGYSTATIDTVDAENVTIFLQKLNAEPNPGGGGGEPPPYGTIRGTVTASNKLANPDDMATFDMAIVQTTRSSRYNRGMNPGPGSEVMGGTGRYEIISRVGDVAVVALCGVYNQTTDTFDAQYMGVARYLFVADEGEYEADILCDIPLDHTASVKLVNPIWAPEGPDNNQVQVFWDFGFEGMFPAPASAKGLGAVLDVPKQPRPDPRLTGMTWSFTGGSYTGDYAPSTQVDYDGVGDIAGLVTLPALLDIPEPVSPQPGGVIENNTIQFEVAGSNRPDFYSVYFIDDEGKPIWQFFLPGDATSVRLPEFPDFSYLPEDQRPTPLATTRVYMTVVAVRIRDGFDYDEVDYRHLSFDAWEAHALTRWAFATPQPGQ